MNRRSHMARMPRNPGPRMPGPNPRKPGYWPYHHWCWNDWYWDDWYYDYDYDWDWDYDYDWGEESRGARRPGRPFRKSRIGSVLYLEAPLVMNLLEYAKNENPSEMELQHMVARMLIMCENGEILGADYYDQIIPKPTPTPPMEKKE